jgi:tetratricopeptide (TPR) repeat protein
MSISEDVTHYITAAVRAYGAEVLEVEPGRHGDAPSELGRRLLQEIYAASSASAQLPRAVEDLIADPADAELQYVLENEVERTFNDDSWTESIATDLLVGFYREEIEAGNTEAMVGLGDLLRWQGDPEAARVAYQQAVDCGSAHAMIDLARLMRGDLGDVDSARVIFERAIESGNAEVSWEASLELGNTLLLFKGDIEDARSAFERVIASGHPEWAPSAMVSLGRLMEKEGDITEARTAYQRAIKSGNSDSAERASAYLSRMPQ